MGTKTKTENRNLPITFKISHKVMNIYSLSIFLIDALSVSVEHFERWFFRILSRTNKRNKHNH